MRCKCCDKELTKYDLLASSTEDLDYDDMCNECIYHSFDETPFKEYTLEDITESIIGLKYHMKSNNKEV